MPRDTWVILTLFVIVYIVLTLFHPGGLMAYVLPSICWIALALVTLYTAGLGKIRSWTNRRITLMALLVAISQIFILLDAGLVNKFGVSPLSFTPLGIAINSMLVSSTLLGMELSRGYLTKNLSRKRPTLAFIAITLLYTFTNISILILTNFQDPFTYAKSIGENFLPTLTENLLATYLALLSGPVASLAYRAPLQAFTWFSPILPDLPWGYQSLIGVMAPAIGFIAINAATTKADLKKAGLLKQRQSTKSPRKSQTPMKGWLALSIILVLAVWASTGLFGFRPTIVASGSMNPALDVGDIAVVIQTDPTEIKVGDIIQYMQKEEMILHRVVEIPETEEGKIFITKGDANKAPDADVVFPNQIRGKLLLAIPKLGWISICIKWAITETVSFFTSNITLGYAALATATIALVTAFRFRWNSPSQRLRRRLHR